MFKKKEFLTIFLIIVTETLGFSLILPFLPFYAQELGATPIVVGLLLTTFSFIQFFSAPIMGRLSDIYGRKPLLILSQISTFLGFMLLGLSNTLWMIFLARIIDGLLGSNFSIAQAYLSDISTKEDRSKALGVSGAAFGVGMLIGPGIGGMLSTFSYSLPAYIAAGITVVTIVITAVSLKETVHNTSEKKFSLKDIKIFDFSITKEFSKNTILKSLVAIFIAYIFSHSIFVSSYALYGERQLGFGAKEVGFVLFFVGLTNVIIRGFLLSKLIDKFSERKLKSTGIFFTMLSLGILVFAANQTQLFVAMIFFALGSSLIRPVFMGEISRNIDESRQGEIMGFTNSIGSIANIIGPILGGYIINYALPGYLPLVSFIVLLLGIILSKLI